MKNLVKYQIYSYRTTFLIFYGIQTAIMLLLSLVLLQVEMRSGAISGSNIAAPICLFSMFAGSVSINLKFFIQNGFSRKTAAISMFISLLLFSVVMGTAEILMKLVFSNFSFSYLDSFQLLYSGWTNSTLIETGATLLWNTAFFVLAGILGAIASLLTLALRNTGRIILWAGTPLVLIGLLLIDSYVWSGILMKRMQEAVLFLFGLHNGNVNPLLSSGNLFLLFIILCVPGYMLVRRYKMP